MAREVDWLAAPPVIREATSAWIGPRVSGPGWGGLGDRRSRAEGGRQKVARRKRPWRLARSRASLGSPARPTRNAGPDRLAAPRTGRRRARGPVPVQS